MLASLVSDGKARPTTFRSRWFDHTLVFSRFYVIFFNGYKMDGWPAGYESPTSEELEKGLSMATSTLRLQKRRNTPYCIWVRLHSELRESGPSGSTALGIHPKTGAQRARKVLERPGQSLVTSEDWSQFRG